MPKKLILGIVGVAVFSASLVFGFIRCQNETFACRLVQRRPLFDLKVRDQDEPWGDGVKDTWSAQNMKPGDEFPFEDSFVHLRQYGSMMTDHLKVGLDYSMSGSYGARFKAGADDMARKMIITRLEYYNKEWHINLLNGASVGRPLRPRGYKSGDWSVQDADGDGRITFFDLKSDPLDNLPPPQLWMGDAGSPYMVMSVKFADEAGNEYMGAELDVSVIYELNGCCRF